MKPQPDAPSGNRFLTTGQIAAHCGVNFRTVIRWIKKGYLRAQRLPGRGDHRVEVRDFVAFLHEHQLRVPEEWASTSPPPSTAREAAASRVLIVDDDLAMARAIQRALRSAGYDTQIAQGGFEAGIAIESYRPHLITLDLLMNGMDGFGVLASLRKLGKLDSLRVLVLSADTEDRLTQARAQGAHAVLRKPFTNEELIRCATELAPISQEVPHV